MFWRGRRGLEISWALYCQDFFNQDISTTSICHDVVFRISGERKYIRSVSPSVTNVVFVVDSCDFLSFLCFVFLKSWRWQNVHAANNSLNISNIYIWENTQQQPSRSWIKEKNVSLRPSPSGHRMMSNKQSTIKKRWKKWRENDPVLKGRASMQ